MNHSIQETVLKALFPMRTPSRLKGLSEREAFNLRYREVFGCEATDSEYEDYYYSPGECRVSFMGDFGVGSMVVSTIVWMGIIGGLIFIYHIL